MIKKEKEEEKLLDIFKEEASKIYENFYDYSRTKYDNRNPVIIICKIHGEFKQSIKSHLKAKRVCPGCHIWEIFPNIRERFSKNALEKAKKIHKNFYCYDKFLYNGIHGDVIIICKIHGEFKQQLSNHLSGKGCLKCSHNKYSRTAIEWLEYVSKYSGYKIQHAENDGEFKIDGTNFYVDGYIKELNKVLEFHGDYWHGNPKLYNPDNRNDFNNKTFGELYQKTLEKKKIIINMGYNYEEIWESDWNKMKKTII